MRSFRSFFSGNIEAGAVVELDEGESRHLVQVRRCRVGDEVLVLDGAGAEWRGRVAALEKRSARLEIAALLRRVERPSPRELHLALVKSSTFDDTIQRGVELGMTAFQPLAAERSVVELDEKRLAKRSERWRKLAVEGLKQCERLWLPEVRPPLGLRAALEDCARRGAAALFLAERSEKARPLPEVVARLDGGAAAFFVGPEGGWSPAEWKAAEEAEAVLASLGEGAILRAETAALAALGVAMAAA